MSKYLGKLLLEAGAVNQECLNLVCVRYVQKTNQFMFRYEGPNVGGIFCAGAELVYALCAEHGYLECQYQWSVGYTVRPLKGLESLVSMRNEELELLGGKRNLVLSGKLDNDQDFDYLCAIQYLYKFSDTFFKRLQGHWKRDKSFVEMERRVIGKCGRKKGGHNQVQESEEESREEIFLRIEHNKKVAVQRGFLEWYVEACKEECKVLGQKFDKNKVLEQWQKLREKESD